MKARVKETGEIVEVKEEYDLRNSMVKVFYSNEEDPYDVYEKEELDFDVKEKSFPKDDPDYWTRLEHTYAGMAMQGMLNNSLLISSLLKVGKSHEDIVDEVTGTAVRYAHALVEKYKEKEK